MVTESRSWETHVRIFEAICTCANSFYVGVWAKVAVRPTPVLLITDVPPLGINLHQGWGVRSVIEIGVVLWLWTGKSLCSVIQRALRIHRSNICGDLTLRYASENNFANLRSGEVFFRIIVIFEACGERPGAVNWMHDNYR